MGLGGGCPIGEGREKREGRGKRRERRRDRIVGLTCYVDIMSALTVILSSFNHFNDLNHETG